MYKEDIQIILGLAALLVIAGALIGWSALSLDRASCYASWKQSGYAVRWGALSGCQLNRKSDTEWFPADSLRNLKEQR